MRAREEISARMPEREAIHEVVFSPPDVDVNIYIYKGRDSSVAPHWHDAFELLYVLESSRPVEIVIDGQEQMKAREDLLLFNTGATHEIAAGVDRGIALQIPVKFWKQFLPEYERFTFSLEPLQSQEDGMPRLLELKRMLVELYNVYTEKPLGYRLRFNSILCQLMYILISCCAEDTGERPGLIAEKRRIDIAEVMAFIEQHYSEKLSLTDIARRFGYHPNYLSRLFHQASGHTVLEYIYMIRINHVYNDLLYTEKPIQRILEDHGCTNPKVTMRMFKSVYQATFREIRKRRHSRFQEA